MLGCKIQLFDLLTLKTKNLHEPVRHLRQFNGGKSKTRASAYRHNQIQEAVKKITTYIARLIYNRGKQFY